MASKKDKLQVTVEIEGKQTLSELGKMEIAASEFRAEINQFAPAAKKYERTLAQMAKVGPQAKEWKKLQEELNKAKVNADKYYEGQKQLAVMDVAISKHRDKIGDTALSYKQLTLKQKELLREMQGMTRGTAHYNELQEKLQSVNRRLAQQQRELRDTTTGWDRLKTTFRGFGGVAMGALAAEAAIAVFASLTSGVSEFFDMSAKLSDAMADVQKTTGLTSDEVKELAASFDELNTRTGKTDLLALATIAGKLGVKGVKDVQGFVSAADKINVALGEDLGETETVMKELGKLTETFGLKQAHGLETSLIKVGSAINTLGASSSASEGFLVDFSKRMGGIAPLTGITIQSILGTASTLDQLGQTSETSSTALSKLFVKMAKDAGVFAKFAGMEVGKFKKLMNEDANEAFIRVLEGVGKTTNGISDLTASLGELGVDGGRITGVLGVLANNTKMLRSEQELANRSFADGTSVLAEYELKNNTLAANFEKARKAIAGFILGSAPMKIISETVGEIAGGFAKMTEHTIIDGLRKEAEHVNILGLELTESNISQKRRAEIIAELQTNYPDYIGNLNLEAASNHEIALAINRVNEKLMEKIILQRKDEQLQKLAEKKADLFERMEAVRLEAQKKLIASEKTLRIDATEVNGTLEERLETLKKLAEATDARKRANLGLPKERQKAAGQMGVEFDAGGVELETAKMLGSSLSGINEIKKEMLEIDKQSLELMKSRDEFAKMSGLDAPKKIQTAVATATASIESEEPLDDKAKAAAAEKAKERDKSFAEIMAKWKELHQKITETAHENQDARLDEIGKELKAISSKYEDMLNEAERLKTEGLALAKDGTEERFAVEQAYLEEVQRIWKEHGAALVLFDEQQNAKIAAQKKEAADKAAEEAAKQRAEDKANLALFDAAQLAEAKKVSDAKHEMLSSFANLIGETNSFIGSSGAEMAEFQKVLALSQIAVSTGLSLAKIIPLAIEASAFAGPAAPFAFAGYVATMTATVLGAMASAAKVLNKSETPAPPANRSVSTGGSGQGRSFAQGGFTGRGFAKDETGKKVAGIVHANEFVIPEFMLADPLVADIAGVLEAIRTGKNRGFAQGGFTDQPQTPARQTRPTPILKIPARKPAGPDPVLQALIEIKVALQTPNKNYVVLKDIQTAQETMDFINSKTDL
jgi:TP901 family phage tail tape measure protein